MEIESYVSLVGTIFYLISYEREIVQWRLLKSKFNFVGILACRLDTINVSI